mmetsp:Transcript_14703/g.28133  ORF Transcript_14703/g.28133 Transcript_14703/m.28133 type:complete len:224 (-) Transcript_14703:114-785(-)
MAPMISSRMTFCRCARHAPPPGTMPISLAESTELSASSYRSFLSFSSVSVAAPTLIRAMPPPSAATRSVAFSVSKSVSAFSASFRICAIRASIASCCFPSVTMVVCSFATTIRSAVPSMSVVTESSVMPTSSATYVAPVAMAMSCRYSFRRIPKPGALMATTSRTPRILLTTRADSASPVTSSATMKMGSLVLTSCSRRGTTSFTLSILASVTRTRGLIISAT